MAENIWLLSSPPPHHFLLLFGRSDEAGVCPAGAEVVVQHSGGIQSEQHLHCGTGLMWSCTLRTTLFSLSSEYETLPQYWLLRTARVLFAEDKTIHLSHNRKIPSVV